MSEEKKTEEVEAEETEKKVDNTSTEDVKNESKQESQPNNSIPYERFQQVIEEKNEYKNQLQNLQKELENMEDPEEVKKNYEQKLEEIENKTVRSRKEYALKTKALEEGVRKEALEDIVKVADLSKLMVGDDDNVTGVDELIKGLKENKSFYFTENEKKETKAGSDFNEGNDFDKTDKQNLKKFFGINT